MWKALLKGMSIRQEDRYPTMDQLIATLDTGATAPSTAMKILAGVAALFLLIAVLALIAGILL